MNQATVRAARWGRIAGLAALVMVVAFGICEALGWPFLAAPMQRWLGDALQRRVSLSADPATQPQVRIRLLGSIGLQAAHIEIGAPPWSTEPYMLRARDAHMKLGYGDLWRARGGEPLRIRELRAAELDSRIERRADGSASWQFGKPADTPERATHLPVFGRLQVDAGRLSYRDALIAAELDATYSLVEGSNITAAGPQASGAASGLRFTGKGSYQKQPLSIELKTDGVLPVIADDAAQIALPVRLEARIGGAAIMFEGTATDALKLSALKGRFSVQGPSLAALGDPLNVTLPTTGPFRAQGLIAKEGVVWNAVFERATIGASRLAGVFTYDPQPKRPLLSGRLTGAKLLLADLGPTVGAPTKKSAAVPEVVPTSAAAQRVTAAPGRVLPAREFDLPSLRAMDANVLVEIDNLDLGSTFLEPLKPLRTHLVLIDGVLTLRELDARTGQGRLFGSVALDGRSAQALWTADLRWSGVRLESWIRQVRADNAPPWATGRLDGQARVAGQGKSTAAILGTLRGEVRMQVKDGTVSHLAVEAAGLDVAQSLGVLIKGDDALVVRCSVVDLVAEKGLLKPRAMVIDTDDSTLWVDGSLSLATESMDLRVVTSPKDFSPLALRTPVRVHGSFAKPAYSLEKGQIGMRVGAAALLALLNPLAAVLPLLDPGSSDEAKKGADTCRALSKRIAARPTLAAPAPAKPAAKPR